MTDTSGIEDHGLNAAAWSALQQSLRQRTIQHAAYIESVDARDYEKNAAYFGANGYDVIIMVGEGQAVEARQVAAWYSDVVVVGLGQAHDEPQVNLVAIPFPYEKMGFVAGWLAAHLTETGSVGAACETSELQAMRLYCEGFSRGALSVQQNLQVLVRYRDAERHDRLFKDPDWGRNSSLELIDQGADVLFAVGGGTAQGALLAAADAGAYSIGSESDQWQVAPRLRGSLVTSVLPSPEQAIQELLVSVRTGALPASSISGTFSLAPFRPAGAALSEGAIEELARLLPVLSGVETETGAPPP